MEQKEVFDFVDQIEIFCRKLAKRRLDDMEDLPLTSNKEEAFEIIYKMINFRLISLKLTKKFPDMIGIIKLAILTMNETQRDYLELGWLIRTKQLTDQSKSKIEGIKRYLEILS